MVDCMGKVKGKKKKWTQDFPLRLRPIVKVHRRGRAEMMRNCAARNFELGDWNRRASGRLTNATRGCGACLFQSSEEEIRGGG